jgi:large subunit ribosomal protein L2
MGLKKYKPFTAGIRFRVDVDKTEITKNNPEKSLLAPKKKSGGRNNFGRVTARFQAEKIGYPGNCQCDRV